MKNDTAHYDASTVLSTLKMLSTEMNILVHPPKNHFIFGGYFWIELYILVYWYGLRMIIFITVDFDNKRASHAERSLQQTEHRP